MGFFKWLFEDDTQTDDKLTQEQYEAAREISELFSGRLFSDNKQTVKDWRRAWKTCETMPEGTKLLVCIGVNLVKENGVLTFKFY